MKFKAILIKSNTCLIFRLLEITPYIPGDPANTNRSFFRRLDCFEFDMVGIYLPGSRDHEEALPRSDRRNISIDSMPTFLEAYKAAYREVNGVDAIIYDLDAGIEFDMEYCLSLALP